MDKSFHAGHVYEPLGNGLTRVKSYADGGALLSDEIMPVEQSVALCRQNAEQDEVTVEAIESGVYRIYSSFSKDSIVVSEQGLRELLRYTRKHDLDQRAHEDLHRTMGENFPCKCGM